MIILKIVPFLHDHKTQGMQIPIGLLSGAAKNKHDSVYISNNPYILKQSFQVVHLENLSREQLTITHFVLKLGTLLYFLLARS